ncbi:hypothetical protein ACFPFX_04565 [Streptomyces mauvecolor]|uniref:Ribbon-helix-helix protein CopG domain-containing protein n=1 Tax=Streptomyces mauvecolor TaxID=58345 RepID=A0ABV9UGE9_9ACTN
MADVTIKISEEVRDRLRTVAKERGVSPRALAESALMGLRTRAEREEEAARGLAYVRAHLCPDLTADDVQRAEDFYTAVTTGRTGDVR